MKLSKRWNAHVASVIGKGIDHDNHMVLLEDTEALEAKVEGYKVQAKALQDAVNELSDILDSFDWEIRGNHALTQTCTRLTDDQIKLLNQAQEGESDDNKQD